MPDPTTPNLDLTLPVVHEQNWGVPTLNENFTLIDTFAGTTVLLNKATNQIIVQSGGSFLCINAFQVDGTTPAVSFGTTSGSPTGNISQPTAGNFTVDGPTPGDAMGTLELASVNAVSGLQVDSAAPNNHILVGNGTYYVDSATLPPGLLYYQRVEQAGTPTPQEPDLNFLAPFTATDSPGTTSTNIALANSGVTPGSYTNATITVGANGLVTAASSGGMSGSSSATVYNVTGARSFGVQYQNNYGGPIYICGYGYTHGSSVGSTECILGPVSANLTVTANTAGGTVTNGACSFSFIVPANNFYQVNANTFTNGMGAAVFAVGVWVETVLT